MCKVVLINVGSHGLFQFLRNKVCGGYDRTPELATFETSRDGPDFTGS